jgi:prepilin-type N-terminal cleavage/methylation domain-containing protein
VSTAVRPRGFNLPELMIALALGLFLLAAFLNVVARCRDQFATNESLARLQDTARSALAALTDDIEHAGFYGFSNAAAPRLVRGGTTLADAAALWQGDAAAPVTGLPAGAHDCGVNYAVDLSRPIEGTNKEYGVGRDAPDCAPTATSGGAHPGSDTLTVRHASLATAAPRAGRIQLYARRLAAYGFLPVRGRSRSRRHRRGCTGARLRSAYLVRRERIGGSSRVAGTAREIADGIARRRSIPRRRSVARS